MSYMQKAKTKGEENNEAFKGGKRSEEKNVLVEFILPI